MFGGIEFDLIPALTCDGGGSTKARRVEKTGNAWLCGELILRGERRGLAALPPELWAKTTAQQLILSGNRLGALPPDVGRLRELRVLLLGGNRMTELPREICDLAKLQRLELQDNLLDSVPTGLAKLVELRVVNLDGNPLAGRLEGGGPTLLEVWLGPGCAAGGCGAGDGGDGAVPVGSKAQQADRSGADGDDGHHAGAREALETSGAAPRVGGTLSARRRAAAAAAAASDELRRRTQRLLRHLSALLGPEEALAAKQAKLALLQREARARVERLVRVADDGVLAACLDIARDAGLEEGEAARIEAARAAAARLAAAAGGGDRAELGSALRGFEELCKPGRAGGPLYQEAAQKLRALVRDDLQRGWRHVQQQQQQQQQQREGGFGGGDGQAAAPGIAPGEGEHGGGAGAQAQAGGSGGGEEAGEAGVEAHGQRRVFLTAQEIRRRELLAAGGKTYEDWAAAKREEAERRARDREAAIAAGRRAKREAAALRGDRAVAMCELEHAWPSRIVEAYPRGTFSGR